MAVPFLEMLEERIPIIFDGAIGTEIPKFDISEDDRQGKTGCNEMLNITPPDVIREIHCNYLKAGAHVIETNTFGANRIKLKEYGLDDKVQDINSAAVKAAKEASDSCKASHPCFICGIMGPTGFLPSSSDSSLSKISFDEGMNIFEEQATVLLECGVDLLLLETMQDLLEARAAVNGIHKVFRKLSKSVPLQVQITMDTAGHMLLGSDMSAFLGAVANLSPAVIGLNCGTGPEEMLPHIAKLVKSAPCSVSMVPNAGMPENIDGKAVYRMKPKPFVEHLFHAVTELGVSVVGGCCGTTPEHIKMLAATLKGKKVKKRPVNRMACFLSTGISGIALHEVPRPFIIGERLNTQGSRKTKEFVLANDFDNLYQLAMEQIDHKATLLDLCMALNERDDEAGTMLALIRFLSERITIPFCIDSTDPAVIEAALKSCPGSLLVNSINLEKNGEKARKVLRLSKDFGCPVIALPIDDAGMAKTAQQKLDYAKRIVDLACDEFGIAEGLIFFDPLVFTLATGDKESAGAANESLEALKLVKEKYPAIQTVMGVSNVSFGLRPKARRVLNNLMLYHASQAGLDGAIFNPLHIDDITSYDEQTRLLGENLLFNKSDTALIEYIEFFEEIYAKSQPKPKTASAALNNMTLKEQLQQKIFQRDKRDLDTLLKALLEENSALSILNTILMPAMSEVGNKLATGEMILPFVLQAAEVMKACITILEPHFVKEDITKKGKIILATVFGDVHDIGKNLIGSILKNQGFEIIDLGKQVPLEDIVASVKKEKPDAVGLSALLVTTSREMGTCVKEFDRLGFAIPVLVGGAAVNSKFAARIEQVDEGKRYSGGAYYAKDAFEAVKILDRVKQSKKDTVKPATKDIKPEKTVKKEKLKNIETPDPLDFGELLTPQFWGTGEILTWDIRTLLDSVDKRMLFKGYWRAGRLAKEVYIKASDTEFEKVFKILSEEIEEKELVDPRGFYGFFPVITDDNTLFILSPSDFHTELTSFTFPRIEKKKWRCFADYFRPESDIISIQIVTIGSKLGDRCREYFQKEEQYAMGFYLNGLGTYITEGLADRVTTEIRRGLVLPKEQGKRFSFGYRGIPDLEEQKKLFELMCIEDRLGITLTAGFQMVPEHSTMGIFVHHKDVEYF
jgi:5-methyltetrahydrofolate--homocysteine methyltransferase